MGFLYRRRRDGLGITSRPDDGARAEGTRKASGVWYSEDQKQSIILRDLRTFSSFLGKGFRFDVKYKNVRRVRMWIDIFGDHFIIKKAMPLVRELRMIPRLLSLLGITLASKWLPSASNYYADRERQTWDP